MKYAVTYSVSATVTVEVDAVDDIDAENKADLIPLDVEKLENITADICMVERVESERKEDCLELVRCTNCGWVGSRDELESGGSLSDPYCPKCGDWEYIVPLKAFMPPSPRDIEQLWDIFCSSLVELNEKNELVQGFWRFPAGTHKNTIRLWFDWNYEGGVPALNKAINRKEL